MSAAFLTGFVIILYKVWLYMDGEGKIYLKIGDEQTELESIDLVNVQVRLMNEQVMQPYCNVICNVRVKQSWQFDVNECLYFTRMDKILVEEPFI